MQHSDQINTMTLFGWLLILAQSTAFFGIFFKLIVLTYNSSHWYSIHDHDSSWQSLRDFVQLFQLGLIGIFLLIPEAELDRLTLRWAFLSLTFVLIAGQMADNNQRRRPKFLETIELLVATFQLQHPSGPYRRFFWPAADEAAGALNKALHTESMQRLDSTSSLIPDADREAVAINCVTRALASAFRPGSPARQGARNE